MRLNGRSFRSFILFILRMHNTSIEFRDINIEFTELMPQM